jgi:two-component system, NarL family, sensor kinase
MQVLKHEKIVLWSVLLIFKTTVWCAAQQTGADCPPLSTDPESLSCRMEEAWQLFYKKEYDQTLALLHRMGKYTAPQSLLNAHRMKLMGIVYWEKIKDDSCYSYTEAAARIYLAQNNFAYASSAYKTLGAVMNRKVELEKAAPLFYKAIDLAEQAGSDSLKINPFMNLADVFGQLGDPIKERSYISKAYALSKKYKHRMAISITGSDLIFCYIEASMLDSARHLAQEVLKDMKDNRALKACGHLAMAIWETAQGNWDAANRNYLQIKTDSTISEYHRITFSNSYAKFLKKRKLYKEARPIFEDVITLAKHYKQRDLLYAASKEYYGMLEATKDYKRAFEIVKLNTEVRDSVYTLETQEKIRELNIKYETVEQERLLQASRVELAEQTNQRNLLLGGVILIALLGGGIVLRQRYRIQLADKTHEQESELAKQKLESLRQEQNFLAFRSMVAGEEAERNRLAKELHDGLGGMLSNLKLTLTNRNNGSGETPAMETVKLVDNASNELRRIAQNMMPESLARFGLISALEDLCADIESHTKLQTCFQHYGVREPLPQNMILPLYRIVQESLNNVVKHSNAREAMVQLIGDEHVLHLTIEDDGNGFLPEYALESGGSGLKNLQSRVAFLNGTIEFDSMPGDGTAINIDIPMPKEL